MERRLYVLVFVALLSVAVPARADEPAKVDAITVVRGNNQFAFDLFAKLGDKQKNLFFSPYSISNALAMTYAGARGDTAAQMAKVLHFKGGKGVHTGFAELIEGLQGADDGRKHQLFVANSLWGQAGYDYNADFLKLTREKYRAELTPVDFQNDAAGARKQINKWVEDKTKDKIKELIQPDALDSMTRLVLTNAIYFKAAWMNRFAQKDTKKGDFLLADGKKAAGVEFMNQTRTFRLFQGPDFQLLEMPYENDELHMLVFLPAKPDGLAAFEKALTADRVNEWHHLLRPHMVTLTFPKFKFTSDLGLNKELADLGMPLAFIFRKADFSGIATPEPLYIAKVIHKAFVDVNEQGTEAAAASAVVLGTRSLPPRATFKADHPFVFLIREASSGSILFLGRVCNP